MSITEILSRQDAKGPGLELSIAKRTIEANPEKGSTFSFTLPKQHA